jgi:hypothetical protein
MAAAAAAAWVVVAGTAPAAARPPVEEVEAALARPADGVQVVERGGATFALRSEDSGVEWDRLPVGRRDREDGADTWVDLTTDPGVARVVVHRDGRTHTLASEELDAEALVDVGLELPGDDGLVARLRRACEALLGSFSGD